MTKLWNTEKLTVLHQVTVTVCIETYSATVEGPRYAMC